MSLPISGERAWPRTKNQRASRGTQNTFAAAYSSRFLSGFFALGFLSYMPVAFRVGEVEQQLLTLFLERIGDVFEKDETKNDVLVFPASMCPRILSAAAQSCA